ncbi:MAG TPA: AI-2E family transporter [Candidatus Acidoferrales bacterium]|jgi:predicted PurR-regulated permease PerM|nr:AI-2E family transporter [Candidatus Acidoferrales bacterium]
MVPRPNASKDLFHLLAVVVAVVVIVTLYFARIVLIPFALALLFTFILTPLVKILERARFGRIPSALLVVLLALGACGAVGWTVTKQFSQVVDQLPDYKANIRTKLTSLHWSSHHALDNASQTMTEISKDLATAPTAQRSGESTLTHPTLMRPTPEAKPIPVEIVKPPALPLESMQNVLGLLASVLIVLVFTIFMLIRREDLRNRLISLAGDGNLQLVTQTLDDASARVSRYLLLQFVVNACYGIFIGTCLHFIGLPGALLWGVIVGTLRFLPYIGPPLGGIMPLLLSLAVFDGWTRPLIVLGLFVFTELIVSNLVEPLLYGIHTGISSLAILVAAIFWTAIWGPIGLVLSTPLTVCLLVVGRHVPRLRFLQILLGDEPPLTPDSRFYQRLLAMDHEEARQVLEGYLEGKTLEELYDSVLIPALSLAEQDRHENRLEDASQKFICQSTRELIDELWEPGGEESAAAGGGREDGELTSNEALHDRDSRKILCLPARDEADEIVAIMLAQVLETAGHQAQCVPLGTAAEMLAQVKEERPDVVCISALPPFAIPHARSLYAKLRAQDSKLRVVVGLWNFSADPLKVNRRLGLAEGSRAFTTLAELRQELEGAADVVPAAVAGADD